MWVFGFGSLMWGGWHQEHDSLGTKKAKLNGYCRRFNKGSTLNWGTKHQPGPTLNIVMRDGSSCQGVAFQFSEEKSNTVLEYLRHREGKAFEPVACEVILDDGQTVAALVFIYRGKNILENSNKELAEMAMVAEGKDGKCVDYVLNVDKKLKAHGIEDSEVLQLVSLVSELMDSE